MSATPIPKPIHIAIIGGGIGGIALAIGLSKYPHLTYTIYESRSAFGEIGAGVGFSGNGHKVMSLISPDIWERYKAFASFNGSPEKRAVGFEYVVGEKGELEGKRIAELVLPKDMEQSTCHRKHLLEVLVGLLPENRAKFGKKLVALYDSGEKAVCKFTDGTTAEADVVIGCDGVKSACRPFVYGQDSPLSKARFTGKVAYRGLIPMNMVIDVIGKDKALNRIMYLGKHRHMLTMGVAKNTILNIVAFHSTGSDTWEGSGVQPRTMEEFQNDFAGWGHDVSSIISLIPKPEVWAIFDHPRVNTFHNGRICLLGDAAHATSPHYGMGAGMAIEDAYFLSSLLGHCSSTADIPAIFNTYDTLRVDRTCNIVAASRLQGQLVDFEIPEIGDDLEKIADQLDGEKRRWLWDIDLEGQLNEALKKLGKD